MTLYVCSTNVCFKPVAKSKNSPKNYISQKTCLISTHMKDNSHNFHTHQQTHLILTHINKPTYFSHTWEKLAQFHRQKNCRGMRQQAYWPRPPRPLVTVAFAAARWQAWPHTQIMPVCRKKQCEQNLCEFLPVKPHKPHIFLKMLKSTKIWSPTHSKHDSVKKKPAQKKIVRLFKIVSLCTAEDRPCYAICRVSPTHTQTHTHTHTHTNLRVCIMVCLFV